MIYKALLACLKKNGNNKFIEEKIATNLEMIKTYSIYHVTVIYSNLIQSTTKEILKSHSTCESLTSDNMIFITGNNSDVALQLLTEEIQTILGFQFGIILINLLKGTIDDIFNTIKRKINIDLTENEPYVPQQPGDIITDDYYLAMLKLFPIQIFYKGEIVAWLDEQNNRRIGVIIERVDDENGSEVNLLTKYFVKISPTEIRELLVGEIFKFKREVRQQFNNEEENNNENNNDYLPNGSNNNLKDENIKKEEDNIKQENQERKPKHTFEELIKLMKDVEKLYKENKNNAKKAFFRFAQIYHPDKHLEEHDYYNKLMQYINVAWEKVKRYYCINHSIK